MNVEHATTTTNAGAAAVSRRNDPLRAAVGKTVGSVFYGTLMKGMRETRLKGAYGHGGRGEEVFAAQLHGLLAERMGMAGRDPLKEALYRQLERQQRLIDRQKGASLQELG